MDVAELMGWIDRGGGTKCRGVGLIIWRLCLCLCIAMIRFHLYCYRFLTYRRGA